MFPGTVFPGTVFPGTVFPGSVVPDVVGPPVTYRPQPAPGAAAQFSSFVFCAANSSSVITPLALRSASLVSSSAAPEVPAACFT